MPKTRGKSRQLNRLGNLLLLLLQSTNPGPNLRETSILNRMRRKKKKKKTIRQTTRTLSKPPQQMSLPRIILPPSQRHQNPAIKTGNSFPYQHPEKISLRTTHGGVQEVPTSVPLPREFSFLSTGPPDFSFESDFFFLFALRRNKLTDGAKQQAFFVATYL